ncbi:MAG: phosphonate ABC transporter ATP-binding protein, partial [Pseudomonadota bacterium]
IGLRAGAIEFDGPPTALTPDVLTRIYGEEDWEATIQRVEDDIEIEAAE